MQNLAVAVAITLQRHGGAVAAATPTAAATSTDATAYAANVTDATAYAATVTDAPTDLQRHGGAVEVRGLEGGPGFLSVHKHIVVHLQARIQKNPAYGRHWISRRVQIVASIPKRTELFSPPGSVFFPSK